MLNVKLTVQLLHHFSFLNKVLVPIQITIIIKNINNNLQVQQQNQILLWDYFLPFQMLMLLLDVAAIIIINNFNVEILLVLLGVVVIIVIVVVLAFLLLLPPPPPSPAKQVFNLLAALTPQWS